MLRIFIKVSFVYEWLLKRSWDGENVRLCAKSCLAHLQRSMGHGRWDSPNNSLSQEPPACPRPICTSPEGPWEQQQAGRQVQDSEKGHPGQACPWRPPPLLARCEACQDQSAAEHLLDWGEPTEGWGTQSGIQGKSISELSVSCCGMLRWGSAGKQRDRLLGGTSVGKTAG